MRLFDHEAELGLIGAALVDPRVTVRVGHVPTEAFDRPEHGLIWRAMMALGDTEWDALAVRSKLAELGGGAPAVEALRVAEERAISAASAHHYAEAVRDRWQRRRLVAAAEAIDKAARSRDLQGSEVLAEAETALMRAVASAGGAGKPLHISEGLKTYIRRLHEAQKRGGVIGLSTGIPGIDRVTKGLRSGQVMVIAGRPGSGKSVLADQIADHVASSGAGAVLIFNLEMEPEEIASRPFLRRLQSTEDQVLQSIRTEYGAKTVTEKAAEVYRLPIHIETRSGITIAELRSVARRHKLEHPDLKLIVIDYVGLVRAGLRRAESREREVAHVSQAVKELAKELELPILLLSQLNREAERGNREPRISDLRESGSIEQDADIVLLIHHNGEPWTDGEGNEAAGEGVEADLIIAKNRGNPTRHLAVWFRKAWLRFDEREVVREEPAPKAPAEPERPFQRRYSRGRR